MSFEVGGIVEVADAGAGIRLPDRCRLLLGAGTSQSVGSSIAG